jgi:hypothetical protein
VIPDGRQAGLDTVPGQPQRPIDVVPPPRLRWWQNPLVVALAVIVVVNLLYALPRYLTFDPDMSRNPIDPDSPMQFPLVIVHLLTGNLAMVTVFLQVLPSVRRRYPKIHRISGRLYIFGGVLPSALVGLYLLPYLPTPFGQIGLATEATMWVSTTAVGFYFIRKRKYLKHRRWMVYSFALALGTSWSRVLYYAYLGIPGFNLDPNAFLEITSWLGWMVNLLVAQWWLERTARRQDAKAVVGAV